MMMMMMMMIMMIMMMMIMMKNYFCGKIEWQNTLNLISSLILSLIVSLRYAEVISGNCVETGFRLEKGD